MNPITLQVPREKVVEFSDDLTSWTSTTGIDPREAGFPEIGITTNTSSPVRYQIHVDESFFEQFPHWRQYIEH